MQKVRVEEEMDLRHKYINIWFVGVAIEVMPMMYPQKSVVILFSTLGNLFISVLFM